MKKIRFLPLLLVAVMLFSAFPFGALAEGEDDEITRTYNFTPTIKKDKLFGFTPGTTEIDAYLLFSASIVEIYNRNGDKVKFGSETRLTTGFKIKVNGTLYTLIIMGDLSCDGKMNAVDYTLLKRAYMRTAVLDENALLAAGVAEGESIRPIHYLRLKRACYNTTDINHEFTCDPYTVGAESGWTEGWV